MGNVKRSKLSVTILFVAIFLLLFVGIFYLGEKNSADVYANSLNPEVEVIKEVPPTKLADLQSAGSGQLNYWADNLSRFDGREFGYITPEGNQGSLGICWAYAAVGAVEANILRDGVDPEVNKDTLDLDEIIAAYARFNRDGENDPLYLTTNDTYSSDTWKSSGDFADNAFMSMTQGFSLVDQISNQNWSDWALKQRIAQSKYFIQGFKQIEHSKDAIKRAILEYGGVTMEYKAPENIFQQYVHHAAAKAGHASLIIGWDDSVSKSLFWPDKPSSDGAWIIKNSWGAGGDDGVNGTHCFYLSYEAYMTDNLYVVDTDLKNNYQNLYYYDGNIGEDTSQYYADAYGAIFEAKLSTANENEQLAAVSFGIRNTKATVDIKVYKLSEANFGNVNDEINRPDSGILIGSKDGVYFEDDGFYTVDFDEPIDLEQGEIFSIVISGSDSKGGYLNPYFALDNIDSVNDMTYRKYMDEWTSFKGYKGTYPGSSAGSCVRLRAITNLVETDDAFDNDLQYARMELESKFMYYEKDKPQTPELTVYFGDRILKEGEDYEVAYFDNSKPGKASVKISGLDAYYGEQSTAFEIAKPKYPPGMISGYIEVYSDAIRLKDVPTPEGWKWNEDLVLASGDSGWGYQMKYTGDDGDCYQYTTCSVKIFKNNYSRPAQLDISGATVTIADKYNYIGTQIEPDIRVVCKGHELKLNGDYTFKCQNNTNVGTASIIITGQGGYFGSITKKFEIRKAKWPNDRPNSVIYVEENIKNLNQIPLNCSGWMWQAEADITSDAFQATAVYVGKDMNNFVNTKMTVTIIRGSKPEQKDIASIAELRLERDSFKYDGQSKMPSVVAVDGEEVLLEGKDFEVEYKNNVNAGQASVIVKGKNGYVGSKTLYFTINKADRTDFKVAQQGWTYGESALEPSIEGQIEAANVTYSYSDAEDGVFTANKPTKAGAYWIKATIDESQNYNSAEAKARFIIGKADHPALMPDREMTIGRKIKTLQAVALSVAGWEWEDPLIEIDAETIKARAVYFDKENYENYSVEITLTKEEPKDVSKLSVYIEGETYVYDGKEKTPQIIVEDGEKTLIPGEDFDVLYQNNKFAGRGKAVVTCKNDYKGTKELEFTILQAEKPSVNTTIHCDKTAAKLSDIPLPYGFVWEDDDVEILGDRMIAKAVYKGEDASSYKTVELTFEIVIDGEQQPILTADTGEGNLIWAAIFVPVAVLLTAGIGIAIFVYRRKKNHRK